MSETKCRHEWIPDDTKFSCAECGDWCAACNVCEGPTDSALLVCQRCLDREAKILDDIDDALSHWQPQPRSVVPAVRYDKDQIHRSSSGTDGEPDQAVIVTDSPSEIRAVLSSWESMWRELSKTNTPLSGLLLWAAHNAEESAWGDYRREMRQLRHRARRLAGLTPQRQAGRCIYCGRDVVRDWADRKWRPRADGLSDELRCTGCRTRWEDRQHWQFANRHTILALPMTSPEQLVTREDARMIFPAVPAPTWRSWVMRDARRGEALLRYREMVESGRIGPEPEPERMPVQSWDRRGRPLYRLADLTALVEARLRDTRPGPKVRERRAG